MTTLFIFDNLQLHSSMISKIKSKIELDWYDIRRIRTGWGAGISLANCRLVTWKWRDQARSYCFGLRGNSGGAGLALGRKALAGRTHCEGGGSQWRVPVYILLSWTLHNFHRSQCLYFSQQSSVLLPQALATAFEIIALHFLSFQLCSCSPILEPHFHLTGLQV